MCLVNVGVMFAEARARRTWTLTSEPVMEPPRLLKECAAKAGLAPGAFTVCGLGETTVA